MYIYGRAGVSPPLQNQGVEWIAILCASVWLQLRCVMVRMYLHVSSCVRTWVCVRQQRHHLWKCSVSTRVVQFT